MRKVAAAIALLVVAAACTSGGAEPRAATDAPTPPPVRGKVEIASPEPVTEAPGGWFEAACDLPLDQLKRVRRGYVPGRSPELLVVPREP
ncbi:MAG: hypothetical protein M3273_09905, partial [Actinomycetota bacterium]|nr:hypothetical protein [Actinomycetota bacterium]